MSKLTKIEWTDTTWNPVTGCTKISPGCKNCYAEAFAHRFQGVRGHPYSQGFNIKLWPERLELPLNWRGPRRIFVNSMSDLFHEKVPDEFILRIFNVMSEAKQHIFQILTKRSTRLVKWGRENLCDLSNMPEKVKYLPSNVWIGVSVESQDYVHRIVDLKNTPAVVRFVSIEPMLGPIDLKKWLSSDIHWVIVGGESGPRARPMQKKWVLDIQEQCLRYKVPFFFKQWGTYNSEGKRVGKRAAGRVLEGRVWDQTPDWSPGSRRSS